MHELLLEDADADAVAPGLYCSAIASIKMAKTSTTFHEIKWSVWIVTFQHLQLFAALIHQFRLLLISKKYNAIHMVCIVPC